MGTYGFVRIAMPMLPGQWRRYALVFVVIGVVSAVYGALVALAQASFKRMIAYTSVNHMGYILLGVGAAGILAGSSTQARSLAVTGAVTQMVSHGLLTGVWPPRNQRSRALFHTTNANDSAIAALAISGLRNPAVASGSTARL